MKGLLALENVIREVGTPYFSSLYDIDDWNRDLATIKEELQYAEAVNNLIFDYYLGGLRDYTKAAQKKDFARLHFYMGAFQTCLTIYAEINNVSLEEAEMIFKEKIQKLK